MPKLVYNYSKNPIVNNYVSNGVRIKPWNTVKSNIHKVYFSGLLFDIARRQLALVRATFILTDTEVFNDRKHFSVSFMRHAKNKVKTHKLDISKFIKDRVNNEERI